MIQVIFSMVYNRVKIKGASSEVPFIKNIQLLQSLYRNHSIL